jgi:hypothetical protein
MPRLTFVAIAFLTLGRHPLHTTHTELAEEPGGRVTVTVRSFRDDLRMAVGKLEPTGNDSAIAWYVRSTVELRDPTGRIIPLIWDSARTEGDIILLSLHGMVASGLRAVSVRQAMQMELYDDQVNLLQAKVAGRIISLLFLPGDGLKALR